MSFNDDQLNSDEEMFNDDFDEFDKFDDDGLKIEEEEDVDPENRFH